MRLTCAQARLLAVAAAIALPWSRPCAGQAPPGRLEERVTSVTDTSQAYALYLPPGYRVERRWPVLFVLDPRGRALLGLELFQAAAAQLGYVILSSYNTLSDGPSEPNLVAMNAMLTSAQARLAIDPSRLYLAGFSGTARLALRFAVELRGHVAGVIAAGGALGFELGGPETTFAGDSTFAYFGAAGTGDFNYEEVRAMGDRFRTTRVPFRIVAFDGPHSWPPVDVCGDALEWLELRAMRGGLRPMDSSWVRTRLTAELARASELERLGRWDEAAGLNEAIGRDYAGWPDARGAAARAVTLRSSPVMVRYEAAARRLADRDQRQGLDLPKVWTWARAQRDAPAVGELARKLHIAELQKTVERGDSLEAASARRLLARIFVHLAFYEPRSYLADGSPDRALRMFATAVTIGPIHGEACRLLGRALGTASEDERERLAGQCPPVSTGEPE